MKDVFTKNTVVLCIGLLAFLCFSGIRNGEAKHRRTVRRQVAVAFAPHKVIAISPDDSQFVAKYSHVLGVSLDSCCNRSLIAELASWLKVPYRAAGHTKAGTDCSGFVSSIYKEVFGINLSHSGVAMFSQMKQIVRREEKLQEGDILYFRHRGNRISHVAIYLKDGKFIHAATYGRGVVVDDLRTPYYRRTYMYAGRVFPNIM